MKLLDAVKTKLGGREQGMAVAGTRQPLTKDIAAAVRAHMSYLSRADLTGYTFERRSTFYPAARYDLVIFDETGAQVLSGREMDDGQVFIWH